MKQNLVCGALTLGLPALPMTGRRSTIQLAAFPEPPAASRISRPPRRAQATANDLTGPWTRSGPAITAETKGRTDAQARDDPDAMPDSVGFFDCEPTAQQVIPLSETRFDSTGAAAEFFVDTNGTVTRLILSQTEGDARYDRKP